MPDCCCTAYRKTTGIPKPTVAIAGATGYVGKLITEEFIIASETEGWVGELRILTRQDSEISGYFSEQGVKIKVVDYAMQNDLIAALEGCDVVICTIGAGPGTDESKKALLAAIREVRVKVYIPSEFGINHYTRIKSYTHPIFTAKQEHFKEAKSIKHLKIIRILCSHILERTFGVSFGMHYKTAMWTIVGQGKVPVALTSEKDVGQFTVAATFIAFRNPKKTRDLFEVYSDMRTIKEFADVFNEATGRPAMLDGTPLDEALERYKSSGENFNYLQTILMEEGANDYRRTSGNKELNPSQLVWKYKKVEDFVKEISSEFTST